MHASQARYAAAAFVVALFALSPHTEAQASLLGVPTRPPTRLLGLGTSAGVGGLSITHFRPDAPSSNEASLTIALPTIDGLVFVDDHLAVGLSVPISFLFVDWLGGRSAWSSRLHVEWSFGDWIRFLVGPGVRFDHVSSASSFWGYPESTTQVSLVLLLGAELLSRSRLFGIRFLAWPSIGVGHRDLHDREEASGSDFVTVGATAEVAFVWYVTQ